MTATLPAPSSAPSKASSSAEPRIVRIPPSRLVPHPKNPRGAMPLPRADVAELMSSIDRNGQQQPALVRPTKTEGFFEIVLGRRRHRACELLGEREVLCIVEDLDDDHALALMLSEQATKEDPDPILEAEAVAALLARPGWTLKAVADQLGKSPRWVAQRDALRSLSPAIRRMWTHPDGQLYGWPLAQILEVAQLSPEAQDDLAGKWKAWSHVGEHQLDVELRNRLHLLGKAPWKLDDATLEPKAGACTTCPKSSLRSPGLFDDDLEAKDVSKATCRDSTCWDRKAGAHRLVQLAKLKEETGKAPLVVKGAYGTDTPKGFTALEEYSARDRITKKSDPLATPALVVGGDKDGKVLYLKPAGARSARSSGSSSTKPAAEKTPAERLKDSKAQIANRRKAFFLEAVREEIEKRQEDEKVPSVDVVMALVAAYGVTDDCLAAEEQKEVAKKKGAAWAAVVWPRLQITNGLRHFGGEVDLEEAEWLAELLNLDTKKIEADAIAEIPDPKWWGTAAAAPAKKGGKTKPEVDRRRAAAGDVDEDDAAEADESPFGDDGGDDGVDRELAPRKARKGGKRSS